MDKEQARFILQSFRPDGADAQDPDFAEALAVAAADRDLGEWLASERSQDAAFAESLHGLLIPADLRENILSVLRGEPAEDGEFSELDATFIGALATVRPPAGLRDQIVTAMRVETRTTAIQASPKDAPRRVRSWLKSAAVAAAVVLGAFVALELTAEKRDRDPAPVAAQREGAPDPSPPAAALTLTDLENRFIHVVAEGPSLDLEERDPSKLNAFLEKGNGLSTNGKALPRGLEGLKSVGCQLLKLGKSDASLLCFDAEGQTVHLVVVRRRDLATAEWNKLARLEEVRADGRTCHQCPATKVSVAVWGDDENAFLLLGRTDPDELRMRFF